MLRGLTLVILMAFVVTGCEDNPAAPTAGDAQLQAPAFSAGQGGPILHRLTVGGADSELYGPPGSDANFSLVALQFADGSVRGQWSDQYGEGVGMHAEIDCLYVDGNTAWISGTVTKHTVPDLVGRTANAMVRDGGDSGDDMLSPVFFFLPFTCDDQFPFDAYGFLHPVNNGQVKLD